MKTYVPDTGLDLWLEWLRQAMLARAILQRE